MKQKLLLFCLTFLIAISTWAKDMTVRIVDSKDIPIPDLSVRVTDPTASYNGDYGDFTTNTKGEFTMPRTNLNFLKMTVDTQRGNRPEYELVWNGGDDPVVIKMEGYYSVAFVLKGIDASKFFLISNLEINGWNTYDVTWDEEGKTRILFEGTSLTWRVGGRVIGSVSSEPVDLTTLSAPIEINNPLEGKQQVSVSLKNEDGTFISGSIRFKNPINYNEFSISTSSNEVLIYYIPISTYNITVQRNDDHNDYILIRRELVLSDTPVELAFSYEKAKKITIKVFGIDGEKLANAEIRGLTYGSRSTDENGEASFIGIPGTYSYSVYAELDPSVSDNSYSIFGEMTIADQDMTETVSYQGKYFRIGLDIKLPTFITDRSKLRIELAGYHIPLFHENSQLYTDILESTEEGDYSSYYGRIYYPNMHEKEISFELTKHDTITVDMAATYHTVTFVPNDATNYALSDITVAAKSEYNFNVISGNIYYAEDGEYKVKATITDLTTQESYQASTPQAFIVNGQDRTVIYALNTEDYHKVTITAVGADGKPLINQEVAIYDKSSMRIANKQTDTNGIVIFNLPAGQYECYISPSGYHPSFSQIFMLDNEDININASFENYKKLTVKLTGDLLSSIGSGASPYVDIYNYTIGVEERFNFNEDKNGNYTSREAYYLPIGKYSYKIEIGNSFKTQGISFELNEDKELAINLSTSDYHKVTLNVIDKNDRQVTNGTIYIQTPAGKKIYKLDMYEGARTVYLPNGNYKAIYLYNDYQSVLTQDFTVSDEDKNITFVYKEPSKSCILTIKAKGLKKTNFFLNHLEVYWNCQGFNIGSSEMSINTETGEGETTVTLPEGTYTYSVSPNMIAKTGTITVSGDQELILDYTSYYYLYVYMTDEKGNKIEISEIDEDWEPILSINQNGKSLSMNDEYISGLFPQGTYEIWAWYYGYKVVTQSVTITDQQQIIAIKLPKADPNNFIVYFSVYDKFDNSIDDATISLNGYGEYPTFGNELVFADVTAGSVSYTVKSEGYETCTGMAEINEQTVDIDGLIEIDVYLKDKSSVTIEKISATNAFRVYPTIVENYIHIYPTEQESTEWNIRLTSSTGAAVYMDKRKIDGDMEVSVNNMPKGLYILTLSNGEQISTYKIIKK